MSVKIPSPVLIPPRQRGGGETQSMKNRAKKRRVVNMRENLDTGLNSDVTSATTPLAIEGVKDGYGKVNLAFYLVKIKGKNGGKEKGTAPADHTMAPAHSVCLAVDACCKCGPMLRCKTARCKCQKAACVCVSCQCMERCFNRATQP